jgi:sortase B
MSVSPAKIARRALACAACFSFAVSAAWLAAYAVDCRRQEARRTALAAGYRQAARQEEFFAVAEPPDGAAEPPGRFELLRGRNSDALCWLTIPALGLEEPVVAGRDNRYYLSHDFDGTPSRMGTLFLDKNNTLESDNILLYGHAARDGSMFGGLKAYRDAAFLQANPCIWLDAPQGGGTWEIIAVLLADPADADGFFAWQRAAAAGDLTAEAFAARCRAHAIQTGAAAGSPGVQFLSLVTCAYDSTNARLVILTAHNTMEVPQ